MIKSHRRIQRILKSTFKPRYSLILVGVRFFSDSTSSDSTPLDKLIYPESPSKEHSDLASFLSHVERTRLNKRSTVYRGTHYEYTIAQALSQYGFFLKRVGGPSDRGVDLLGTWTLPSTSTRLKTVLQCKAGARSPSPSFVRELKGALAVAPPGWRGDDALGLLVGEKPATKGVVGEILGSDRALGYVCCSREGDIRQILWNGRAQDIGLEGVAVGVRHEGEDKKLVLLREGEVLPLLNEVKDFEGRKSNWFT